MRLPRSVTPIASLPLLAALSALGALALPAWAQYKVVGPDGRVTYTDRPPADASAEVTTIGRGRASRAEPAPASSLPLELRRLTERFPVVLFTGNDCSPCDTARAYLRQRGVPYTERLVLNNDDIAALERTVAGRTLPALTVGGQALRGYSADDWSSYLDAAGYPRESRLPPNWEPAAPTPLVARAPARAAPAPAPVAEEPAPAPPPPPQTGTTIRF